MLKSYPLTSYFTMSATGFIDTGRRIELRSIASGSQIATINEDGTFEKWRHAIGEEFEDNHDKIKVIADNFDLFWFPLKNNQKNSLDAYNLFYHSGNWRWDSVTKTFNLKSLPTI